MARIATSPRSAGVPAVITSRLEEVKRRESYVRLAIGLADALALFLAVLFVALVLDWSFTLFSTSVRVALSRVALASGAAGLVWLAVLPQLKRRSLADVAGEVDRSVPDLEERWQTVTKIFSSGDPDSVAGSPEMIDRVVAESVAREHLVDARRIVPAKQLRKHQWLLAAAVGVNLALFLIDAPQAWTLVRRFVSPAAPISLTEITADPGDLSVARGEPIRLQASVARRMRTSALLFLRNPEGKITTVSLVPTVADRSRFAYAIESAKEPFSYRFRAGDGETPWHDVSISERPRLTKVELRLVPPAYTRLPAVDKSELPTHLRAVEGSQLEIAFAVDQALEHFDLQLGPARDEKGPSVRLTPAAGQNDPNRFVFRTRLEKSLRLTPKFVGQNGLANLHPPSCQVIVYPDHPPEVTIVSPDKEISLKPDDLVTVEISARDDFGVARAELVAYVGDNPDYARAKVIASPAAAPAPSAKSPGKTPAADRAGAKMLPAPAGDNEKQNDNPASPAKGSAVDSTQPAAGIEKSPAGSQPAGPQPSGDQRWTAQPSGEQPQTAQPAGGQSSSSGDPRRPTDSASPSTSAAEQPASQTAQPAPASEKSDPQKASPTSANAPTAPNGDPNNPSPRSNNPSTAANSPAAAEKAAEPPKTIVMPIPLGGQKGDKKVRAKVTLDLRQFKLKQGQELRYMVRVFDSRDAASKGQSYGGSTNPPDSNPADANESQASASPQKNGATPSAQKKAQPNAKTAATAAGRKAPAAKTNSPNPRGDAKDSEQANDAEIAMRDANPAGDSQSPRPTADNKQSADRKNAASKSAANKQAAAGKQPAKKGQPSAKKDSSADGKPAADKQLAESSEQNSAGRLRPDRNGRPDEQQGEMTGAPRPPDDMTRRMLDLQSQSSASSTMKIHIDQWAGTFEGQQRHKIELAIDPVIQALDAALAKAQADLRPVSESLQQAKPAAPSADDFKKSVRSADTHVAHGQSLVADLVKKSEGTPYAFIGLKLVDVTELHLSPARLELKGAKPEAADKLRHVVQAEFHITRAREMLTEAAREYETAKRNVRLAEEMQRIKTMYQVFVEDAMAMVGSDRGTLNPRDRKMAELELDEEFMKNYTELQKRWQQTLAELARVLAKDPRLLARYMNLSRKNAETLRDQLTILSQRQQDLMAVTEALGRDPAPKPEPQPKPGSPPANAPATAGDANLAATTAAGANLAAAAAAGANPAAGARAVRAGSLRDLGEIVTEAVAIQEDLGTWLPRNMKEDDPRIAPLRELAAQLSTTALQAATAAAAARPAPEKAKGTGGPPPTAKRIDELGVELKALEGGLAKLSEGDEPQLVEHINRRLAKVRKLEQLAANWTQRHAHLSAGRPHRALELDQHRLSEETLAFVGKLDNTAAVLAGIPDDLQPVVQGMIDEMKEGIRFDVLVDQMSSELGLRDRDLPGAKDHQKKAIDGLAKAEERFTKLIDRVIAEEDKVPPEVGDIDDMQLPTLEDLLARLESENDLAELLGIPDRPTNLQQLGDWLGRSGGAGGGGGGRSGMANGVNAAARLRAQLAQRAQRDALRALRKAQESAARPTASAAQAARASRWNTLGSRLDDAVRQGRGNTPPRQYRRAIERYFELISGAREPSEPARDQSKPATPGGEMNKAN